MTPEKLKELLDSNNRYMLSLHNFSLRLAQEQLSLSKVIARTLEFIPQLQQTLAPLETIVGSVNPAQGMEVKRLIDSLLPKKLSLVAQLIQDGNSNMETILEQYEARIEEGRKASGDSILPE